MKRYLHYLLFLLVITGVFFLFSANTALSTSHGTCTLIASGTIPYCGQSGSICGPSAWINNNCDGLGSAKTGNNCCAQLNYDYCEGTAFLGGLCGPGDAVSLPVKWYCCLNPTPTPTNTPTPN